MIKISARDDRIFRIAQAGMSRSEIAAMYGLTPERVRMIVREVQAKKALAEKQTMLRVAIRRADDLDRLWDVGDLMDVLEVLPATKRSIVAHYAQLGRSQITLRELMDLVLLDAAKDKALHFQNARLLGVHGVGKKGYWSVVDGLTRLNLGTACNEAWEAKLTKIRHLCRIYEGFSLAFPE
jgi:hypothetical protein